MGVAAGFALVLGVPFALGVSLGSIRLRRPAKLTFGASFPALVAALLLAGSPFSLVDLGIGPIAAIAVVGWLLGFALATDVRRAWQLVAR